MMINSSFDLDEIVHIFYTQMEVKPPIPQAETESYISKISKVKLNRFEKKWTSFFRTPHR